MAEFKPFPNERSASMGAVVVSADWRVNADLLRRIKRAYRLALGSFGGAGECMWAAIFERQRDVHDALMGEDDTLIATVLSNPAQNEVYYGMDTLFRAGSKLLSTLEPHRIFLANFIYDTLVRVAEATGVHCAFNPEGGGKRPETVDVEAILSGLDRVLGFKVEFPNPFDGEFGLITSRGLMGQRLPLSLYQAWRISELAGLFGGKRTLEIGAGVGRTAYYARIMGITDYTIVDLPLGNVGQAIFLGSVLGPDAVWMPGDPVSAQAGRIRLFPPDWIKESQEKFDVATNFDSLTEMTREQAMEYFRFANEHSKVFLSINHEGNLFRVHDLPSAAGLTIKNTRYPCPSRQGYIEECFFNRRLKMESDLAMKIC